MQTDSRGLAVTSASDADIDALNTFSSRLLRLDQGMETILSAAHEDAAPMVQMYAASFFLYGQTEAANAKADSYLERVSGLESSLNEREAAWLQGLRAWRLGAFHRALDLFEGIFKSYPADLSATKTAEFLYYVLGQQMEGPRFLASLRTIESCHQDDPDFLSMLAFAHELCGEFTEAEAIAEKALALEPRNPWAHHALSHVLIKQGRPSEGRRRMEEFMPLLQTCGRVIYGHDAWHLGLLCLEEMDHRGASAVYSQHVWGFMPDAVGEQVDAIALLWRLEMAGGRADREWAGISRHVADRVGEAVIPFISAHQAYALARAGNVDALERLLETVRKRAGQEDDEARLVWRTMGQSLVEASAAYGKGDHQVAATVLTPIRDQLMCGGGSDAQVDLFRQMYFMSLAGSGHRAEAREILAGMTANKHLSELDKYFGSLAG